MDAHAKRSLFRHEGGSKTQLGATALRERIRAARTGEYPQASAGKPVAPADFAFAPLHESVLHP
jgi:hypothetical protein